LAADEQTTRWFILVVALWLPWWLPWWFPPQETELRGGEELCNLGGAKLGKAEAIFPEPAPAMIKSGGISSIVSEPYSTARRCSSAERKVATNARNSIGSVATQPSANLMRSWRGVCAPRRD
jgi:hypothetical protein